MNINISLNKRKSINGLALVTNLRMRSDHYLISLLQKDIAWRQSRDNGVTGKVTANARLSTDDDQAERRDVLRVKLRRRFFPNSFLRVLLCASMRT